MTHALKSFLIASVCCAIIAVAGATGVAAQEGGYKIGVVNMNEVLAKYDKRKAKYEELEKQVKALQAGIDQKSQAIEAAKKDYEAKRDSGTPADQLAALELKIRNDYVDYQALLTRNQQEIDLMEKKVLEEVLKDVQETVQKIAEAESYHLILNRGGGNAVLYSANSIDITSKVLAGLNK